MRELMTGALLARAATVSLDFDTLVEAFGQHGGPDLSALVALRDGDPAAWDDLGPAAAGLDAWLDPEGTITLGPRPIGYDEAEAMLVDARLATTR